MLYGEVESLNNVRMGVSEANGWEKGEVLSLCEGDPLLLLSPPASPPIMIVAGVVAVGGSHPAF